ncbi:polyprenyl synthetase family protein [Microbispora sp. NPDC049125]|uniref:polyprenyl synthetase family protein n=1 Tax=Microbispora sp. NPDC049125 TaxID=3154929 RepID=UPI0034654662
MVTLARETSGVRELVDRHLDDFLDREMERLDFLGEADLGVLRRYLVDFVTGSGKRLRPSFVYWGHRAAGGSEDDLDAVLSAGCAVELLHACALILDDVMDEAGTRRGRITAHAGLAGLHRELGWSGPSWRFGESAATLLGMMAFTWADAALLRCPLRLGAALEVLTQLRVELIGGQYLDLVSTARGSASREQVTLISTYKSGKYTVERPLHLGHAIAGGDPALRRVLSAYALPLGEAFQLRDDVLGVFGDPAVTGKPAGADLLQGKQTYLTAVARERAGAYGMAPPGSGTLDAETPGEGPLGMGGGEAGLAAARELIVSTGALDAVERRIADLVAVATGALDGAGIPADAAAALVELAGLATGRSA